VSIEDVKAEEGHGVAIIASVVREGGSGVFGWKGMWY
jgi:hypothetical protein